MTITFDFESPHLTLPEEELTAFCERNHIRILALFGSVTRDDFTENSDIDVLVEFEPEHTPGFHFFSMQDELAGLLGREVDLNTLGFLSRHMRETVREEAVILYDKT